MLLNTKLLFELAVYRIDETSYNEQFLKYREENSNEYLDVNDPSHLQRYGQWEYNEIIGFLKFYISGGTQIRCEYHETDSIRKMKTTTKRFIKKDDSFCVRQISKDMTNEQLILKIEECIDHCKKNLNPNRFIDSRVFNDTYKHTDWKQVIA